MLLAEEVMMAEIRRLIGGAKVRYTWVVRFRRATVLRPESRPTANGLPAARPGGPTASATATYLPLQLQG